MIRIHRLITLSIFFLYQLALTAQYEIIKYQFSESYETDEMYLFYKNKELDLINELNILRDSIIYSDKIEAKERLKALQLFNNLYSVPNGLTFFLRKQDDDFAWFTFSQREEVEQQVSELISCLIKSKMILNAYVDIDENRFVKSMRDIPDYVDNAIKYLGLKKNRENTSIFFKRLVSNVKIDKCLRNKDIYFAGYGDYRSVNWAWFQQQYAHKKQKKRNNDYYSLIYNPSTESNNEFLDYIIDGPSARLDHNSDDIKMLKQGGRYYVEIRFLSEQEYEEGSKGLEINDTMYHIRIDRSKREPRYTKDSLKEFITLNDLEIQREVDEGRYIKYVFRKK